MSSSFSYPSLATRPAATSHPSQFVVNHAATMAISALDGSIATADGGNHGVYADDTRFISNYQLRLNGRRLRTVGMSRISFRQARWLYVAQPIESVAGDIQRATVTVTLDRIMSDRCMHEEITVRAYGQDRLALLLTLSLGSDFADLFEVRSQRWQRRTNLGTSWLPPSRLECQYVREDFVRRCLVRVTSGPHDVGYANGALRLPLELEPGGEWCACIQYDLITHRRGQPRITRSTQSSLDDRAERLRRRWHRTVSRVRHADARLIGAFDQSVDDFAALRLYDQDFSPDVWIPAAGIPWFVALFGRDSIIASLQALPVHPLFAIGTLQKLAAWQARDDDAARDAEPGKIPHELRTGEWAHFGTSPHSPYYGTADATPLYLLLLGETYRWLGDADGLRRFREVALRCLEWIDRYGDIDGDGFQEYQPRTPGGYRNQCWRDAEDGVLDEEGNSPPHPIGTCEMQAYVYAAKLSVARLFEHWGDGDVARALVRAAHQLRQRFLEAWWLDDAGTVAFGLDGDKRALRTATSNPGHCLWLGMVDDSQAHLIADRLMQPDLFTGWGLRTLSSHHPKYDPHSYQRGSVWPHDTMIAAAGMRRYGRLEDCWRLLDALFDATSGFPRSQLPELFAGLPRTSSEDAPMPYEHANTPQAWAAGVAFHALRVMLGLQPDAPGGRVYIDPMLPRWCPRIEVDNVRVGDDRLRVRAHRRADGGCDVDAETARGTLEVVRGTPPWTPPVY